MMSFLKIAQQFFVCEYFLLIPIDVPSFKLIEDQIKKLQGMVPNTPRAENDQKSPGRIGLNYSLGALCRFPIVGYTRTALESINN